MNKNFLKSFCKSFFSVVLVAVLALSVCGCDNKTVEVPQEVSRIIKGEGDTSFYFDVVDANGSTTYFEIHTDQEIVGDALLELQLIEGEEGPYGLFVKKVNDIEADFDKDQTYWAFYINGEYANTGVDATSIEENSTYAFKVEK